MTRYRSEIGWSFVVLYALLLWRLGWPLVKALVYGDPVDPGLPIAAIATLGGLAFVAATTSYTITTDTLVVRCGFSKTVIALSAIRTLRATRTLLAAPALSLNRLEVVASPGPRAVISPVNQSRFVRELVARAPQVQLEGLPGGAAG
jgi:hypothetical protein